NLLTARSGPRAQRSSAPVCAHRLLFDPAPAKAHSVEPPGVAQPVPSPGQGTDSPQARRMVARSKEAAAAPAGPAPAGAQTRGIRKERRTSFRPALLLTALLLLPFLLRAARL